LVRPEQSFAESYGNRQWRHAILRDSLLERLRVPGRIDHPPFQQSSTFLGAVVSFGEAAFQAELFVGRAGQLLTDILTKGMGMRRERCLHAK